MRITACASFALLALAFCGGKKPPEEPPNRRNARGDRNPLPPADDSPPPVAGAAGTNKDEGKKPGPCGGFELPDLLSVISQAACEVGAVNPSAQARDLKDVLEIRVVPDSPRIAPGSTSTITVMFKNKGKTDLPLDFVVDPEPRFDFEVYTLKGARVDAPKTPAPSLPPEVANATVPEAKVARITLAQQGTAKLSLKWVAVKYKWASKERAKGALPGRVISSGPSRTSNQGQVRSSRHHSAHRRLRRGRSRGEPASGAHRGR